MNRNLDSQGVRVTLVLGDKIVDKKLSNEVQWVLLNNEFRYSCTKHLGIPISHLSLLHLHQQHHQVISQKQFTR